MCAVNRRSRTQGRPENAHPGRGKARHRRPETAPGPVRDCHHRALQAQGIVRGGVSHRDVPGGRIRAPRGGRHRAPVRLETCSWTATATARSSVRRKA